MTAQEALEIPGFQPFGAPNGEMGPVEKATRDAIVELTRGGWVTAAHGHLTALAIATANDFDHVPRTKAYGIAQMTQAVAKVFEMLPIPEATASSAFEKLVADLATAEEQDRAG